MNEARKMKSKEGINPGSCLFITGFMGVGKSYWARQLARALQLSSWDVDACIEKEYKLSIAAIFERGGERLFRSYENKMLRHIVTQVPRPAVIALGGGSLIARENQVFIRSEGPLICMKDPKQFSRGRVDIQGRPLWDDDKLELLYDQRKEGYSMADAVIVTDGRSKEAVVDDMIKVWENHGSRP